MDLFAEQALFPQIIATFQEAYKTLKRLGCSDEALCHEMWMSKEVSLVLFIGIWQTSLANIQSKPAEIFEAMANEGFVKQLGLHSTVRFVSVLISR